MSSDSPTYLDHLVDHLVESRHGCPSEVAEAFGRHLHFGFWENPSLADGTAEGFARAAERLTRLICREAVVADGQKILDVGCGIGGTLQSINEHRSEMTLIGLNIDAQQVELARRGASAVGANRLSFRQGDASSLPFQDRSFDTVLAVECIFDFPSRRKFFSEVFRVLRPGGRLTISDLVATPSLSWFLRSHRPLLRWLAPPHGQGDISYTPDAYRRLARISGLVGPSFRDVTLNILPSFSFCARAIGNLPMTRRESQSARLMFQAQDWASRQGLLRYLILSFQRPTDGSPILPG